MNSPSLPGRELLQQFNVAMIAPLGGRLNQHWRVERGVMQCVLRRWSPKWAATMDYELRLLQRLGQAGWPVALPIAEPLEWEGALWNLSRFLRGAPDARENSAAEQRERGRLLARLHADTQQFTDFEQRGTWRRGEQILEDTTLDKVFAHHESQHPEEISILRWHLDRARELIADLRLPARPSLVVHGDFTRWNLLFANGQLSGVLDFELAHLDHRVADFALAWRGKYDEVIYGYDEVSPLAPHEWAMITPLWWALLLKGACQSLQQGRGIDEWSFAKLRQRSPLMESSLS